MPRTKDKMYKQPRKDDVIQKLTKDETFIIGQCYEEVAATTIACKLCGSKKFNVGQGSYYTVIKCVNCDWQLCVHEG